MWLYLCHFQNLWGMSGHFQEWFTDMDYGWTFFVFLSFSLSCILDRTANGTRELWLLELEKTKWMWLEVEPVTIATKTIA